MVATVFLLLLLQGLIQYPRQAGNGLDEATRQRMQTRAEYLHWQMARLIQELEHESLEQSADTWGALLLWFVCAFLAILALLLAPWFACAFLGVIGLLLAPWIVLRWEMENGLRN